MQIKLHINTRRPLQDEDSAYESEEKNDSNKNNKRFGKGEEVEVHVKVGNWVNSTGDDESYSDVANFLFIHL